MELLVRRVQKPGWTAAANGKGSWVGDVITIQEDGWPWSAAELSNPDWLVVKVPGVPASQGEALILPFLDGQGELVTLRGKAFDTTDVNWKNLIKLQSPVTISAAQWNNFATKIVTKTSAQVVIG